MVKKKEEVMRSWEIPEVNIEGKELLEIIKLVTQGRVTKLSAKTDDHEFESLLDIEENIELFQGDIEIDLGFMTIEVGGRFKRKIYVDWKATEEERQRAEELSERFLRRISAHRVFASYGLKKNAAALLGSFLFSYFIIGPYFLSFFPDYSEIRVIAISTLLYWSIFSMLIGKLFKKTPVVYFVPRQSFWSRNREKIYVGAILCIIAAALALIAP